MAAAQIEVNKHYLPREDDLFACLRDIQHPTSNIQHPTFTVDVEYHTDHNRNG